VKGLARYTVRFVVSAVLLLFVGFGLSGCPGNGQKPAPPTPDAGISPLVEAPVAKGVDEPAPGSRPVELIAPRAPTVLFLAGLKGYTEPCGCTLDVLVGGIDRIAGYADGYKALADGAVVLDAGNTLFEEPQVAPHRLAQDRARVDVILDGLVALDVASTTPGPNDFALGKLFYLDKVRGKGLEILAANLREEEGGLPLGPGHMVHELGEAKVGVIGVVDPTLFVGVEGLVFSDPIEAVQQEVAALASKNVNTIIVVDHGNLAHAKAILAAVPQVHFVIVGQEPRETDAVDAVGQGWTLEAFDQGRYLGVLQLYPRSATAPAQFANARTSSKAELDRIKRRIEQVDGQIARLPPATPGNEPPMLKTLREQVASLKQAQAAAENAAVELPETGAAFVYRPIAMEPGYPLNAKMTVAREGYNKQLKELNTASIEPIPPVPEGASEYIGTERCAMCHVPEMEFWRKSSHAIAVETLIKRDKLFDGSCIGCHVTGYRQPGGSVMGKLEYLTQVNGTAFTKKLQDVGCESCHGPGSQHAAKPDSAEKLIVRTPGAEVCGTCHTPEHSSKFNHATYVKIITGPGHPMAAP